MEFINNGGPVKIRIGEASECYWDTIKNGERVDLSPEYGRALGFTEIKTTVGQIGSKVVETKQIEVDYTPDDTFYEELISIKGIGKKTAKDIVEWGTREKLCEVIALGGSLPFRDDIELQLRRYYE